MAKLLIQLTLTGTFREWLGNGGYVLLQLISFDLSDPVEVGMQQGIIDEQILGLHRESAMGANKKKGAFGKGSHSLVKGP